jgi:hypothetical protein
MNYNKKKHPKFFIALFGTFFKMFGWIKVKNVLNGLLKKTVHDNKVPTDTKLDNAIEELSFEMEHVWPLVNFIIKEKIMIFFRYKLKKFLFRLFVICIIVAMVIGIYKLYNLYTQKPKIVYYEIKKKNVDDLIINTDTIFIPAERSFFTKDNLDYFASEMDIKYWYYVRKQIIVETGFTSESCTKGYNLFGMKFPGKRETTAIGELLGHAKFRHWVYSLYDYKLWQDYKLKSTPMKKGESYPQWLERIGYAEADTYLQALRSTNWYIFKPDTNY